MTVRQPFCPDRGANQVVTAGATANVGIRKDANQVRIVNNGTAKGYVRTYGSVEAADKASIATCTAADFPIPAGMSSTITKSQEHDRIAYFCATSTTLDICTGEGF